jgi:hypothetical protein
MKPTGYACPTFSLLKRKVGQVGQEGTASMLCCNPAMEDEPPPVRDAKAPASDDEDLAALFDERAAILEYDGGYSRAKAEALARAEIDALRRRGRA